MAKYCRQKQDLVQFDRSDFFTFTYTADNVVFVCVGECVRVCLCVHEKQLHPAEEITLSHTELCVHEE